MHILALVAASIFAGWMLSMLVASPLESPKEVIIKEGQGVRAVADLLKDKGIIKNRFVFIAYTVLTGNEKKLQAGRYIFQPGVTILDIVNSIASGRAEPDDIVVTIPEGYNVWDIDQRLVSAGLIKEGEFARKYYNQEGQFFPDTYRFKKPASSAGGEGETVDTIAEKMKNHLNLKFKDLSLIFSSLVLEDTLTRASILEKEARREEDMRLVAGVIRNRLSRRIALQIDATVAYGACLRQFQNSKIKNQKYKYCDVSQIPVGAEIHIDSPYNSYIRSGLPPGPIANPGIQAIQAVLNPTPNNYLYYLSTRDGSQMIFAKTAAEHAANRRKYLGI